MKAKRDALRVNFNRKLKLEFHGVKVTSDAGLLAYRQIDDAFRLTGMTALKLMDNRTGKNTQHSLVALLGQSVYSRRQDMKPPTMPNDCRWIRPYFMLSVNGQKTKPPLPSA